MPSFTLPTRAYDYRPLKQGQSGWDVFALQTALEGTGAHLTLDGRFDVNTTLLVRNWQMGRALVADGIAGIITQRDLALKLGEGARSRHRLPIKLLMGQLEKESGYLLGNHTAKYSDGSYDLGVTQRNNKQQQITIAEAFHVPHSLEALANSIRVRHDNYLAAPLRQGFARVSNARAWELAAGSHNRPAHTAYLAGMRTTDPVTPAVRGPLSDAQLDWIEAYMDRVCSYAQVYYADRSWPS